MVSNLEGVFYLASGVLLFNYCGTGKAKPSSIDKANAVVRNFTLIVNSGDVLVCMSFD